MGVIGNTDRIQTGIYTKKFIVLLSIGRGYYFPNFESESSSFFFPALSMTSLDM